MPDRNDFVENAFSGTPARPTNGTYGGENDQEIATAFGHYATAQELLSDPITDGVAVDTDAVLNKPEKFLHGYLAPDDKIGYPWPLPGPVPAWPIVNGPMVITGVSFLPSAACVVRLYDKYTAPSALETAFVTLPVPATGLITRWDRLLFPHGLYMTVKDMNGNVGPTVDGTFFVERQWDSIKF